MKTLYDCSFLPFFFFQRLRYALHTSAYVASEGME